MKDLFIPLKKIYYDQFEDGTKDTEYRAYGPRWNEKTCAVGRGVVLSCGYGKSRRMKGTIAEAKIVPPTNAFLSIYGNERQCFAIKLSNHPASAG